MIIANCDCQLLFSDLLIKNFLLKLDLGVFGVKNHLGSGFKMTMLIMRHSLRNNIAFKNILEKRVGFKMY